MRLIAVTLPIALSLSFSAFSLANTLKASFDTAVFKYDSTQVYTEIYYSIPAASLRFVTDGDVLSAGVSVQLTIKKDGEIWRDEAWRLAKQVADSSEIGENENMLDVLYYLMPAGDYQLSLKVIDINDIENALDIERPLQVDLFDTGSMAMSDIELATSIQRVQADSQNVFIKNGMEVLPNPSAVFSTTTPMVYYYLEAYNIDESIASDSYLISCSVSDINHQPISMVKPRVQKKKVLPASVEVGAALISDLPSGSYYLNLSIMDPAEKVISSKTKRFFVYNPVADTSSPYMAKGINDGVIEASEFGNMSDKELDEECGMIEYVAKPEEVKYVDNLEGAAAKRRYLYEFWTKRDPIPATVANELRIAYLNKIEFANENFRTFNRAGWKTDRGRVYILYGQPSDIERYPNNATSFSYQIWRYDQIEGGIMFVFADLQEFGEYMQLHSTKRGEPQNSRWEGVISKN